MRECGKHDQESPRAARFMSQLLLMSVQILTCATLGGVVGGIGGLVGMFILATEFRWQGDAPFWFVAWVGTIVGANIGVHVGGLFLLLRLYFRSRRAAPSCAPGSET
jgi:hypothetical protein